MVQIIPTLLGAALLFSGVFAAPMPQPDSAIGEAGVRSPDGTPITDGAPAPTAANNAYEPPMMAESSSSMMAEPTSTYMHEATSKAMMAENTSTAMAESTSSAKMAEATTTAAATSTTQYGSGSSSWGSGYNDCVQQCMNTYGAPAAQYTPPPSTTTGGSSGGSGATHTVIVAPTKGVLRFVPFTVNATVGDTIHYVWGAGPHTVTKSSVLEPCNKTSDAGAFNSGPLNATATFDQQVTDTNPLFFYCNVPGHCAKGMFGIVNAPSASLAPTTVAAMMPQWVSNSSTLATMLMYTNNKTMGTSAYNWGNQIDVSTIPTWAHEEVAKNVMYSRLVFAANPGMLEAQAGASNPNGAPIVIPGDIEQLAADSSYGSGSTPAANAGAASVSASGTASAPSGTATAKTNGAGSIASSSALAVGIVTVLATFMAL